MLATTLQRQTFAPVQKIQMWDRRVKPEAKITRLECCQALRSCCLDRVLSDSR